MIRHFFLDKTNTILENSLQNLGLNPIMSVGYGQFLMRGLLHFDINEIKELINNKTFADPSKLKFTLKMTNCFSVDTVPYDKPIHISPDFLFERASSFDLMLFKLPMNFDAGRGFDYTEDFYIQQKLVYAEDGSNWYFANKFIPWKYEREKFYLDSTKPLNINKKRYYDRQRSDEISREIFKIASGFSNSDESIDDWKTVKNDLQELVKSYSLNNEALHGGVYSNETLQQEYEKYINGEDSIIIGTQHFDFGSENLSIDITKYVLDELSDEFDQTLEEDERKHIENFGLCLAFIPCDEKIGSYLKEYYVGFFTDNTNTFFHPYVECIYDEYIMDDRESFTLGKENNLYLYVFDDGIPTNLDRIPSCSINDEDIPVKQATKGVYKATVSNLNQKLERGAIYYDKWSKIYLNGIKNDDVELEFSTRPLSNKLIISEKSYSKNALVPSLSGINDNERLKRGQEREVLVDFREKFSTDKRQLISNGEYRIYVYDGNRQLEVIPYTKIEKGFLDNYFKIYTNDFIPNKYHVDIKVSDGREIRFFENVLSFEIISDITERYE